jgi:hypothetical protein
LATFFLIEAALKGVDMTRLLVAAAAILVLSAGAPYAQSVSRGANGSTEAAPPRTTNTVEPNMTAKSSGGVSGDKSCNTSGGINASSASAACPDGSGSSVAPTSMPKSGDAAATGK